MRRIILLTAVFALTIGCKSEKEKEVVVEEEKVVETPSSGATTSEWIVLFDGTDFNQWRGYNTDEMYSEWAIEDGAKGARALATFTQRRKTTWMLKNGRSTRLLVGS